MAAAEPKDAHQPRPQSSFGIRQYSTTVANMDHRKLKLTKVTRKGQVTIPEEMREAFGITEGDFMLVGGTKGLVMLKKLTLPSWEELLQDGERFAEKAHITREQILKAI
jgi:AbrB family looped-hinge helix DNA binding protein